VVIKGKEKIDHNWMVKYEGEYVGIIIFVLFVGLLKFFYQRVIDMEKLI
jgi:hypothetical protein